MVAPSEVWSFLLYCTQQLGVLLGVGAESILLVAYLFSMRDAAISIYERRMTGALRTVVDFGIFLIISSGGVITFMHNSAGQDSTIFEPAFLFKWILIGLALFVAIVHRKTTIEGGLFEGLAGGIWLALLVIHIEAPVTTWVFLCSVFAVWMAIFITCWLFVLYLITGKNIFFAPTQNMTSSVPATQKTKETYPVNLPVSHPMPPVPKSVLAPVATIRPLQQPPLTIPTSQKIPSAAPVVIQTPPVPIHTSALKFKPHTEAFSYKKTVVDPTNILHPHLTGENDTGIISQTPNPVPTANKMSMSTAQVTEQLPAVRVMPRSPEDLETQHRGPMVKFG